MLMSAAFKDCLEETIQTLQVEKKVFSMEDPYQTNVSKLGGHA